MTEQPDRDDPGLVDSEQTAWRERKKCNSYNDLGGLHILVLFEYSDGRVLAKDSILSDEDFLNLLLRRGVIHHIQHHVFENGPQSSSAGFLVKGFPCNRSERAFRKLEFYLLKGE